MRKKLFTQLEKISSEAERLAVLLRDHLKKITGRPRTRYNFGRWTAEMSVLMRAVDIDRIEKAIVWYGDHGRDPYVPVVMSASSFRQKFTRIEAAMSRQGSEKKIESVSPEITLLLRDLGFLWPNGEKEEEGLCAERTYRFYQLFLSHLDGEDGTSRFILRSMLSPIAFTANWMIRLHRMAFEWEGWPKSLSGMHAHIDSPHFNRTMIEMITEFSLDPNRARSYWQKMKGEFRNESRS